MLGYDRLVPHVHAPICRLLEGLEKTDRQVILLPRSHFKSRICSIAYPLWRLVRDPDLTIYLVSSDLALTKDFLRSIKGHIASGALDVYSPDGSPMWNPRRRWTETEIDIGWKRLDSGTPSLSIGSVEVTKVGFHFRLLIEDDLHSEKNTENRDQIEKVIDAHRNMKPLEDLGARSQRLVVGTRWAFGDLYEYLEEQGWPVHLKALYEPDGAVLFPQEFTDERIVQIRKEMGPEKFSAQMLNSPISSETQVFKHSFFKPWDKIPEGCSRYLLLDPAISQKKSGDRSAIMAVYVSKENQIYVREYFAGRLLPDKLMDKLVEMALVHDPQSIGIETVAFQKTIVYELKKRMTKIGRWWVINEIKNAKTSKEERIKGLSPIYANGDVFHGPDMMELEDELLRFPKGQHDDLADALSFIQQVAFPGGVNRILVPEENIGLDSDGKVSTRLNPVIRTPQGLVVLSEMIPEDSGSWLDA